jgi:hypothetical protein
VSEGDRALLERILTEAHVDTRVEAPSWGEWLADAIAGLLERVALGLGNSLPGLPPGVVAVVGWALLALLATAVALIVVRSLGARAPAHRRGVSPAQSVSAPEPALAQVDWRSEAARRLAAGDAEGALAAAWWWFATSISRGPIDAAWTTREVLERSRRRDLEPLGRELDVWMYGPRRPGVGDVAALLQVIAAARAA